MTNVLHFCSFPAGQQLHGLGEGILRRAGCELAGVPDAHLCCGSAGTYSILQPQLSARLLAEKIEALGTGEPDVIATANVGCQLHLASAAPVPVRHWIELLDGALAPATRTPSPAPARGGPSARP